MIIAIQQPEHAPWLGFFDKMSKVDKYVLLDNAQFKKRYFENRNKIKTSNGWQWITIPVISKGRYRQLINDVIIDDSRQWRRKYLNALIHAYSNTAYFHDYLNDIERIINHPWRRLFDLNLELISFFRQEFNLMEKPMIMASSLKIGKEARGSNLIFQICKMLCAKTYISGPDGARYLKKNDFTSSGITIEFHSYSHPVYNQVYGGFISHMSSFDLLFNCGCKAFNVSGKR